MHLILIFWYDVFNTLLHECVNVSIVLRCCTIYFIHLSYLSQESTWRWIKLYLQLKPANGKLLLNHKTTELCRDLSHKDKWSTFFHDSSMLDHTKLLESVSLNSTDRTWQLQYRPIISFSQFLSMWTSKEFQSQWFSSQTAWSICSRLKKCSTVHDLAPDHVLLKSTCHFRQDDIIEEPPQCDPGGPPLFLRASFSIEMAESVFCTILTQLW